MEAAGMYAFSTLSPSADRHVSAVEESGEMQNLG